MKCLIGLLMTVAVTLAVCLFPGMTYAQSGRGWMDGFIRHETAIKPAAGATVELTAVEPRSGSGKLVAKADERGEYKFKDIPYGDYMLRVSSDGYKTYEIEIYIMPDVHTRIHVRLKKK
ncbi:MAG: carboxypeptidase-like regulatory domain-containing protein [Gemmataceae bacterium]|nr:carboxypeptidase-like regulatory domain-containing protein [Gemmataceae bacterium]